MPDATAFPSPDPSSLALARPTDEHLREIMTWFSTEEKLRTWGGPDIRFPFDARTFEEDMKINEFASYAVVGAGGELIGFGQIYERLGRAHLARLVVAPAKRGRGYGRRLLEAIARKGRELLGVKENSLFVYHHNTIAHRCYHEAGFVETAYPEKGEFYAEIVYMVRGENQPAEG